MMMDRRTLLALGGLSLVGIVARVDATEQSPSIAPRVTDLAVSSTRSTKLVAWTPPAVRGVALLSTGHGSWPERYQLLADALAEQGFAVFAPVHVDSMRYPERDKFTLEQGFPERLADMGATVAHAAKTHPGLPIIAVGHSFGTLTALCLGGALAYAGPFRNAAVKAVLGFSTPGRIPGLIQPSAYATLAVPTMIVTAADDVVPGFVTDPADHLFPVSGPGKRYGLVLKDGGHELVAGAKPAFGRAMDAARLFVDGYGLNDRAAVARLDRWTPAAGHRFVKGAA